jgi:hypothetical protein
VERGQSIVIFVTDLTNIPVISGTAQHLSTATMTSIHLQVAAASRVSERRSLVIQAGINFMAGLYWRLATVTKSLASIASIFINSERPSRFSSLHHESSRNNSQD